MEPAKVIQLWPDGPPTVIEGVPDEIEYRVKTGVAKGTKFLRNISDPTLSIFTPAPEQANGHGVIVVPGGGWTINASSHEGHMVVDWLVAEGYTAFLLKYRVQATTPDQDAYEKNAAAAEAAGNALLAARQFPRAISDLISTPSYLAARAAAADDGRRAIELAREQAAAYGVNPDTLGMLGFSAGAFMAVDTAMDPRAEQLAWLAPIYGGETNGVPVPEDAPPIFSAVAQDDILWQICEGLHRDWSAAGRPSEHHVFARGAHGFGMVKQGLPSDQWTQLFLAWLRSL